MGLVVFMWMVANTCSVPVFGGVAALRGVLGVLCLWVDETITESNPIQSNKVLNKTIYIRCSQVSRQLHLATQYNLMWALSTAG